MTLQKAAVSSFFLHLCVMLFLVLPSPFERPAKPAPIRPMIIDFVKIGPKSTAPKLGPQSLPEATKKQELGKEKEEAPVHSATKEETPPAKEETPPTKEEAPTAKKETPPASSSTKTEAPAPSPTKKVKPAQTPSTKNKTKAKTPHKPTSPQKAKKSSPKTKAKTSQGRKAKIDLAKKGKIASSMGDLMGKVQSKEGRGDSNAAFAEMFGDELTGTEVDLLNRHMKRFWNMPSGHEKASDTVVEVELFIRPDGSVEKAKIVDTQRFQKAPQFRIAAESALRAVLDPECSPLPLDPSKYEYWKHMFFVFDPQEMCR